MLAASELRREAARRLSVPLPVVALAPRPHAPPRRIDEVAASLVPGRRHGRRIGAPASPRLAPAVHARARLLAYDPLHRRARLRYAEGYAYAPRHNPRDADTPRTKRSAYEEYHPYGSSAYRSANGSVDVSARRYRYNGKERDEETGLYYYGARYLAAWLGRWTSADPLGIGADGPGLYNYTRGSPVNYTDPGGMDSVSDEDVQRQNVLLESHRRSGEARYNVEHELRRAQDAAARGEGSPKVGARYQPGGAEHPSWDEADHEAARIAEQAGPETPLDPVWTPEEAAEIDRRALEEARGFEAGRAAELDLAYENAQRAGYGLLLGISAATGLGFGGPLVAGAPRATFLGWDVLTMITTGSHDDPNSLAGPPLAIAGAGAKTGAVISTLAGAAGGSGRVTVIGRMKDLEQFADNPVVDTWWKSGRIPGPGEPAVTWKENLAWLKERVARGDRFGIATDPSTLPPVRGGYKPGVPNGYFTARELEELVKMGVEVEKLY